MHHGWIVIPVTLLLVVCSYVPSCGQAGAGRTSRQLPRPGVAGVYTSDDSSHQFRWLMTNDDDDKPNVAGKANKMNSTKQAARRQKLNNNATPFTITSVNLDFSIGPTKVSVTSTMQVAPSSSSSCQPIPAAGSTSSKGQDSSVDVLCKVPLKLDTWYLDIVEVELEGEKLSMPEYQYDDEGLKIFNVPARPFQLRTKTLVEPKVDPAKQIGLFIQDGIYVTELEPIGMMRVTPYIERPSIQPVWTVRIEADAAKLPTLLSNGQLVQQGKLPQGRHFAVWKDPRPKPSYQVAIIAGNLAVKEDTFTSCLTGKPVKLLVYMPPAQINQVDFALYAQKAAMAWHEASWGLPYKADTYTMVGVPGIYSEGYEASQMGIFSTSFLAATPDTRSDKDAEAILRLVGHEFFHTWAGNYVTVSDWHDLTLKEGLTTFMEQAFAADMDTAESILTGQIKPKVAALAAPRCKGPSAAINQGASEQQAAAAGLLPLPRLLQQLSSIAACQAGRGACKTAQAASGTSSPWRRIADVAYLRRHQVPEDNGDNAHPIRLTPSSLQWSPYSHTVYRKGAEVVRMYRQLMGPANFTKGLDNWFKRNEGQARSVDDFIATMSAVSPGTLPSNWAAWYQQPGTPWVSLRDRYNANTKTLTLEMEQGNFVAEDGYPGVKYEHLPIPLKVGLIGPNGTDLSFTLPEGKYPGSKVVQVQPGSHSALLLLNTKTATFTLKGVKEEPLISPLRDFSAPVRVWVEDQSAQDLARIAKYDNNMFARWNAINRLLQRLTIIELYRRAAEARVSPTDSKGLQQIFKAAGGKQGVPEPLLDAFQTVLPKNLPGGTKGYMLFMPSVAELVQSVEHPDALLMWQVRAHVGKVLAQHLKPQLQQVVKQSDATLASLPAQGFNAPAMNARRAKNNALRLLAFDWSSDLEQDVQQRYNSASTMTDRLVALQLLVNYGSDKAAATASAHFKQTYARDPGTMLEWLKVMGSADRPGNAANVRKLLSGPGGINLGNAEQVMALLNEGFAASAVNYDAADGSGYKFLADAILQVDKVKPQVASRLVQNFADYKEMPAFRRKMVAAQLNRFMKSGSKLSRDLRGALEWMLPGEASDADFFSSLTNE